MKIILDNVDRDVYGDIVISVAELRKLESSKMVIGCVLLDRKRLFLGIRLQGWGEYENQNSLPEESFENDARIWEE